MIKVKNYFDTIMYMDSKITCLRSQQLRGHDKVYADNDDKLWRPLTDLKKLSISNIIKM